MTTNAHQRLQSIASHAGYGPIILLLSRNSVRFQGEKEVHDQISTHLQIM